MLFFFIVNIFNRYFKRINKHVEIFENFSNNDSLHDFNSFSFSASKRSFKRFLKRFLNDVTINANNKSSKTFKHAKNKSSDKKNRSHVSKESRVESNVIFYFFTFSLFTHVISRRRRRKSRLFFSFFTSIFSSSFFSFDSFDRFSFNLFRFRIKKR